MSSLARRQRLLSSQCEFKKLGEAVMKTFVARFVNDESGATAIEYGLIAAIVGVGIITGLTQLKGGLNTLFGNINTELAK